LEFVLSYLKTNKKEAIDWFKREFNLIDDNKMDIPKKIEPIVEIDPNQKSKDFLTGR
jgi:hypothetical protein